MQKWLVENDILIYSTGNEDKSIVDLYEFWSVKFIINNSKW